MIKNNEGQFLSLMKDVAIKSREDLIKYQIRLIANSLDVTEYECDDCGGEVWSCEEFPYCPFCGSTEVTEIIYEEVG